MFSFGPPGIMGNPEPHSMYLAVSSEDGCLCLNVIGCGVSIRGNVNVKDDIWHAVCVSLNRKSGQIVICVDGKTDVSQHVEGLVVSEGGVYCSHSASASWYVVSVRVPHRCSVFENINRHDTRKSTFECKLNCDENSNTKQVHSSRIFTHHGDKGGSIVRWYRWTREIGGFELFCG